jgi:hypothetical protein
MKWKIRLYRTCQRRQPLMMRHDGPKLIKIGLFSEQQAK